MTKKAKLTTTQICEVVPTYRHPINALTAIRQPREVAALVSSIIDVDNGKEHFIVLHLNGNHRVAGYSKISTGTANKCDVHPRDVFQSAILAGSVSIVLAHNHPSGDTEPSPDDHKVTKRLKDAGEMLGIKVLDHVIIGHHGAFYSMQESGAF